ncbi:MAG TPA: 4-alpha-glucanotransferase [Chloroflexi bacterium]|nr:4-alpha-glucanotransferase [Chloroflexota bacterium]HBY09246.1 4-alpha-glucanotransferase [Chloroflexota bacterium]
MTFKRASGVLLHPTSLPGPYGIGDIGPAAFEWVNFLASAGCSIWQVLPLGPTGYGDSPYQCFSAFAGNPYLVSPVSLLAEKLLDPADLAEIPTFSAEKVDYGTVIPYKLELLNRAYQHFKKSRSKKLHQAFADFQEAEASWLPDFVLFMALKEHFGGGPWVDWPEPYRQRQPQALAEFGQEHAVAVERQAFRQFVFFRQWGRLREYAHQKGIVIVGDAPIFVAHDSADVWAHPELFFMNADGKPSVVAGVPPDYFSATGQLWGNPLYNWEVHAKDGYAWWLSRFKGVLALVDLVRLDHFRGFAAYWQIPGEAETAIDGAWVPGPGKAFLKEMKAGLGDFTTPLHTGLPIIAEDLGVITADVEDMRVSYDLPGMKIMVFAFDDDASNVFLPHNYTCDYVVYTGTHDNDTVLGWYQRVPDKERDFARRYLARDGRDISWDLIRTAWGSVAVWAIAPLQDLLSLDNAARMNYPGSLGGNWTWRMPSEATNEFLRSRLYETNLLYGRLSEKLKAVLAEKPAEEK